MSATSSIHPTAIIHESAQLGKAVTIGAYCVIGEHVVLGDHVRLHALVCIDGHTEIGEGTVIFPFASLGHAPQDLKYHGEASRLIIGKHNTIREYVTMNPGTEGGGMITSVGDGGLYMVGVHVAHDCRVGNHVIMANNATLAGHVEVGDHVVIGGLAAVHQFVRIGAHAMIGGLSAVEHGVVPFGTVTGERAGLAGLNLVGMKRRGFSRETIHGMRNLYQSLFEETHGSLLTRAQSLMEQTQDAQAQAVLEFILSQSKRSFCVPNA